MNGWVKPTNPPPIQLVPKILTPDGFKSVQFPTNPINTYMSQMWNPAIPPPAILNNQIPAYFSSTSVGLPTYHHLSNSLVPVTNEPMDYLKRRINLDEKTSHSDETCKKMKQSIRSLSPNDMDLENPGADVSSARGRIQQNLTQTTSCNLIFNFKKTF